MEYAEIIAAELGLSGAAVGAALALIEQGNTIPFIARYRKEATGSMDDQLLRRAHERFVYLKKLDEHKQQAQQAIAAQGKWTQELAQAMQAANTLAEIEDLYRPYRPKRKTRASTARERGLEPLAMLLWKQTEQSPQVLAQSFLTEQTPTVQEALSGARDILAELIADDAALRGQLRLAYQRTAQLVCKAVNAQSKSVYQGYYDYCEPASKAAGHRILAIDRGEREKHLRVSVQVPAPQMCAIILSKVKHNDSACAQQIEQAALDAYSRLLHPALERELRAALTAQACEGAIEVFSKNLEQLLLAPPVKGKTAMGLDPGYRMGCKTAVVDATGKVLDTAVIYPVPEFHKVEQAKQTVKQLICRYDVQLIAIGNGTASGETERFTAEVLRELAAQGRDGISYMVVSEAGASVYSASELAAKEFPQFDVNLRSAISIARRLQDPLAELVKIDPKAVGVGQYQHDMPAARLAQVLDDVVERCVNTVGVDLNTASAPLLQRVAGITSASAANIVAYREQQGAFTSRRQLLKVPKLGPKAFEQCAGFLRLPGAREPLDATAVHPESYAAARCVLQACGFQEHQIGTPAIQTLAQRAQEYGLAELAEQARIGVPTLKDMIDELLRPGRDMRDSLPPPLLRTKVLEMKDLMPGMQLQGTVRNVIDFGAFVDIGVHQDGLVHISRICHRFIRHPSEVLRVGDIVTVWVLSVEEEQQRIALTMLDPEAKPLQRTGGKAEQARQRGAAGVT